MSTCSRAVITAILACLLILGQAGFAATQHDAAAPDATCTVSTTADSGAGSLRACLEAASRGDIVDFDPVVFPPAAPAVILLESPLPELDDGEVTVNAITAGVILVGKHLPEGAAGLRLTSDGNTVWGLQIRGFRGAGIQVTAAGNTIGGATAGKRNVICENDGSGIELLGAGAIGNSIKGNLVGADASGASARNYGEGIALRDGASENTVGGAAAGERNVLFANGAGVLITGAGTSRNTVAGNRIGLGLVTPPQAFPVDQAISPAFASDGTLYVATLMHKIMKTTDRGATWVKVSTGLPDARFMQVMIPADAADANTVLALSEDGQLFRTGDGGGHWLPVSQITGPFEIRNLALSPRFSTDQTMYLAVRTWGEGGAEGLLMSTDGGASWSGISGAMTSQEVSLVFAPPDPRAADILFAFTAAGIERSTDRGATWTRLPLMLSDLRWLAISPDYADDGTLFLNAFGHTVFKSTDRGATWSKVAGAGEQVGYVAISPLFETDGTVCYVVDQKAIACSPDQGATWWQNFVGPLGDPVRDASTGIVFAPNLTTGLTLFVSGLLGMAVSNDGGASFSWLSSLHDIGNWFGIRLAEGAAENTIGPGNVIGNNWFGVTIWDAATSGNTIVGNRIGVDAAGLSLLPNASSVVIWGGQHNTIGGDSPAERNVITAMIQGAAISLENPATMYNTVSGNYIGVDATGAVAFPGTDGIYISRGASHNTIGGASAGARNVISGFNNAVSLIDAGTAYNTVAGNHIGTDAAGAVALGNRVAAVQIMNGASDNLIGGDVAGAGNLMSGNGWGVSLWGSDVARNRVSGNILGLNATGTALLGDQAFGVWLSNGAHDNVIGGPTPPTAVDLHKPSTSNLQSPAARSGNLIAGHGKAGIYLTNVSGNTISGNIIGSDATATSSLPNRGDGILLEEASNNIIGGPTSGERNLVVSNWGDGIRIAGGKGSASGNTLQGNWIGLGLAAVAQIFPADQAISPAYPADCTLYLATQTSGVYKSTTCGETWAPANTGLTTLRLAQVKIPPGATGPATLYALAEDGSLFRSGDAAGHWTLVSDVLAGLNERTLGFSAAFIADSTLYASADGKSAPELGGAPGVFKSTDGGLTWAWAGSGMDDLNIMEVVPSPDRSAAATLFARTQHKIYKSTDAAAHWTDITPPADDFVDLAVSPSYATDHTLFATAFTPGGALYRSTDGGLNWRRLGSGGGSLRGVSLSPNYASDHTLCHSGDTGQALCSTDAGSSWTQAAAGGLCGSLREGAAMFTFAPDYVTSGAIFLITRGGAARSADRGGSWRVLPGLRRPGNAVGVALDFGASNNAILENVIGNNLFGITLSGPDAINNTVNGNLVGLDSTGVFSQANLAAGINIENGPNLIRGNVISGNLGDGLWISKPDAAGNRVLGNLIGTNAAGAAAVGNLGAGIALHDGVHDTVIGGPNPGDGNVIGGNEGHGVWAQAAAHHNTITGNRVGIGAADVALPNGMNGIEFRMDAHDNTVGPANTLGYNTWNGIALWGVDTLRNRITANSIYDNGNMGIQLNDGANTLLPAPVILDLMPATCGAAGRACAGCAVEIFSDLGDEGRWYEGATTAGGDGAWAFVAGRACQGEVVRATATDPQGNTSEFSPKFQPQVNLLYLPLIVR